MCVCVWWTHGVNRIERTRLGETLSHANRVNVSVSDLLVVAWKINCKVHFPSRTSHFKLQTIIRHARQCRLFAMGFLGHLDGILCFGSNVHIGHFHYATRHFCYFHIHCLRTHSTQCATRISFFFLISWALVFVWFIIIAILGENLIFCDVISSGRLHDCDTDNRAIAIDIQVHSAGSQSISEGAHHQFTHSTEKNTALVRCGKFSTNFGVQYRMKANACKAPPKTVRKPINSTTYIQSVGVNN